MMGPRTVPVPPMIDHGQHIQTPYRGKWELIVVADVIVCKSPTSQAGKERTEGQSEKFMSQGADPQVIQRHLLLHGQPSFPSPILGINQKVGDSDNNNGYSQRRGNNGA